MNITPPLSLTRNAIVNINLAFRAHKTSLSEISLYILVDEQTILVDYVNSREREVFNKFLLRQTYGQALYPYKMSGNLLQKLWNFTNEANESPTGHEKKLQTELPLVRKGRPYGRFCWDHPFCGHRKSDCSCQLVFLFLGQVYSITDGWRYLPD